MGRGSLSKWRSALCVVALLTGFAGPAHAVSSVLIGNPPQSGAGNCVPFGCDGPGASMQYQQVYDSGEFPEEITIREIVFFRNEVAGGDLHGGDFTITLSTTSKAVNGLDELDLNNNIGGDEATFVENVTLAPLFDGTLLTFTGNPFIFDPANGNLLINIEVTGNHNGTTMFFDGHVGTATGFYSRVHDFNGGFDDYGLKTAFLVPEPGTALLLGGGLLLLAGLRRRES
jgi:hypothetical protein